MRIDALRIENYRNIRLAEATGLPDLILIGGINGCGKSAVLEAIYTAKEAAREDSGNPSQGRNLITTDSNTSRIVLQLRLNPNDRGFVQKHLGVECPELATLDVTFVRGQRFPVVSCPKPLRWLLQSLAVGTSDAPGFFDYFQAHRRIQNQQLNSVTAVLSPDQWRQLLASGDDKFNSNKPYLVTMKVRELQRIEQHVKQGTPLEAGPFREIQGFFDTFFAPMRLVDVDLNSNPFRFIVQTATGEVDLDDLSSGERQIFNTYLHFHQVRPQGAIILFDEPDIHLHPDFARRYVDVLKEIGRSNQLWITTHSPDMMLNVPVDLVYTVLKAPSERTAGQFIHIINDVQRYKVIQDIMGGTGLVGVNEKVVFIEGDDASTDVACYERFFPTDRFDVRFVPATKKEFVKKTSSYINDLLSAAVGFTDYYCIVDRDYEQGSAHKLPRVVRLPRYHIENYFLEGELLLHATKVILREKAPYADAASVEEALRKLVLSESHVNRVARAFYNARLREAMRDIREEIKLRKAIKGREIIFGDIKAEAIAYLKDALATNTWTEKSIGRVLLRAYCGQIRVQYEHFRNVVLASLGEAPPELGVLVEGEIGVRRKTLPKVVEVVGEPVTASIVEYGGGEVLDLPKEFKEEREMVPGELSVGAYRIVLDYEKDRIDGPSGPEKRELWRNLVKLLNTQKGKATWNDLQRSEPDEFREARRREFHELLGLPVPDADSN